MWVIVSIIILDIVVIVVTIRNQRKALREKEREWQERAAADLAARRAKEERAKELKQRNEATLRQEVDQYLDTIGDGLFLQYFPRQDHYTSGQLQRIRQGQREWPNMMVFSFEKVGGVPEVKVRTIIGKHYIVSPYACTCQGNADTSLPCKHMYALAPTYFGSNPPAYFTAPVQFRYNRFAFVGEFSAFTRDEAAKMITELCGICVDELGPYVDYVVEGANAGMEGIEAAGLGAQMLDEDGFLKAVEEAGKSKQG